jgi:hypothetical protein
MRVTVEDGNGKRVVIDGDTFQPTPAEWDGTTIAGRLIKTAPSRRYTLQVAYPADKPDATKAADGFQDFASSEAVEDAAWTYLTKSPEVGLWHEDGTAGAGRVVESYVYRGPDWTITAKDGSEHVIKAGDWMVGIQWSEKAWPHVLAGRVNGVSMQGKASRRTPSPESLQRLRR